MRRARLLAVSLLLCVGTAHAQDPDSIGGRVTFRVLPETVTVGQPFIVNLRAVPAVGRTAVAPPVPDTGGIVEPLDPAVISRRGDTLLVRYRLIAWQPGVLTIPLAPVQMTRDQSELAVPADIRVVVASVLPADSASRVPKAARELFPAAARWWENWWQWLLALLAAISAIYIWHRWRTRVPRVVLDDRSPIARAEAAFARLDARQLPSAGEGGRHVTLATEIVRQYLADIEPALPLTLTNAELIAATAPIAGIPGVRLTLLLQQSDTVRFSGNSTDVDTTRRVSGLARELVREMDRVRAISATQAA
jgi:hypothetical protein